MPFCGQQNFVNNHNQGKIIISHVMVGRYLNHEEQEIELDLTTHDWTYSGSSRVNPLSNNWFAPIIKFVSFTAHASSSDLTWRSTFFTTYPEIQSGSDYCTKWVWEDIQTDQYKTKHSVCWPKCVEKKLCSWCLICNYYVQVCYLCSPSLCKYYLLTPIIYLPKKGHLKNENVKYTKLYTSSSFAWRARPIFIASVFFLWPKRSSNSFCFSHHSYHDHEMRMKAIWVCFKFESCMD